MDRSPTLKQLRYFVALSETGHFRAAAERVGISQPSLSLQISNLEEVLRLNLVERGRFGAVLTPSGREVLARSRQVLEDVSALVDYSDALKSGMSGTIRLGSTPTFGPYILPNVVRLLHERYPALKLIVRDAAPRDLLNGLLEGVHDLVLTQLPVLSGDVVVKRLFREPLHLAVARDHALADQADVVDADLAGQEVLSLSSAFVLHDQITTLCREVGANLRQDYEGTSLDALRQMAAMGMGLAFLPSLYVKSEIARRNGDVRVLRFRGGRFNRSIGLAWRKTTGRQASFEIFADVVRIVAKSDFKGILSAET